MNTIFDLLIEPFTHAFMLRGLLAALMVSAVCSLVGTHMVLRGMAFFGDALAHSILPGLAIGYLVGGGTSGQLFWWGLVTAIISSLGIGALSRQEGLKQDTSIGIIFAGMFALGIALISTMRDYATDLTHFLFGNLLMLRPIDLWLTGIFGSLIVVAIIVFYKEFLVLSFDPILAATLRLPARLLENFLLVLIAIAIVVSLQTVGVALMVAMLVTPAATAFLLTRRLHIMMIVATAIAAVSSVIGLYLSYYASIAPGAAIVLTCTAFFMVAWTTKIIQKRRIRRHNSTLEA